MDREYKDTEYKEVEILTNEVDTANVPERIKVCGFEPEMWKKLYPGLKTDYFSNIQKYCQEKNIDENKINKEVLNLASEVAQQLNSRTTTPKKSPSQSYILVKRLSKIFYISGLSMSIKVLEIIFEYPALGI